MQETVGMSGVVAEYDKSCDDYLIRTESTVWWYCADDLELVSSVLTNDTLDVQTCIDFLLNNGYKVTLEKV